MILLGKTEIISSESESLKDITHSTHPRTRKDIPNLDSDATYYSSDNHFVSNIFADELYNPLVQITRSAILCYDMERMR